MPRDFYERVRGKAAEHIRGGMEKKMKKLRQKTVCLFIFILAAALLGGCAKGEKGKGEKSSRVMGRYVEQEPVLPEPISEKKAIPVQILMSPEERLQIVGGSKEEGKLKWLWQLEEDGSWTETEADWLNACYQIAYDGRDLYGLQRLGYNDDTGKVDIVLSKLENKTMKPVLFNGKDELHWDDMVREFYFLKDHSLVVTVGSQTIVYDEKGKELLNTENEQQYSGFLENKIMIPDSKGRQMTIFDMEKPGSTTAVPYTESMENGVILSDSEGNWYLANRTGIQRKAEEGSIWEVIVDGALCSLGSPQYWIDGVLRGTENDFYVMFQYGDGERQIVHYVYDPKVAAVPDKTISIVSLEENPTIRQAILLYQKKYPDVRVDYQILLSEEVNQTDAVKQLNTELLAGKGADLLLLDGLPVESYIEKGVLEDLTGLIKPLEEKGGILPNLTAAAGLDGKLYEIPLRIQLPVLFGKKELVEAGSGLNQLAGYVKNQAKTPVFGERAVTWKELLELFAVLYQDEYLDADGTINKEAFAQFLENVKIICEQTKAVSEIETEQEYGGFKEVVMNTDLLVTGGSEGYLSLIGDTLALYPAMEGIKLTNGSYALVKQSAVPKGRLGINHNSKNQQAAADFIQTALSTECQKVELEDGYPVNPEAIETWNTAKNDFYIQTPSFEATQPKEETLREFSGLCSKVTNLRDSDMVVMEMMVNGTKEFFEGSATAEAAAEAVIQKVNFYLQE